MPYIEYNKYNTLPEQVEENRINIQNAVNTADNALAIVEENKRVVEENNSVVNSYTNKVDTNTNDISQLKQKDIAIDQSIADLTNSTNNSVERLDNRITESNGRITENTKNLAQVASDVALLKLEQINIRGQWIQHDNYNKNDFAYYNNSLFNCISPITNSTTPPPDDFEHWEYVLLVTTSGGGGGGENNGVTATQTNTVKINGTLGTPSFIDLNKNYNDTELNYTTRKKCDLYLKYVSSDIGEAGMIFTINLIFNSENDSQSFITIPIIKSTDMSVIQCTYLINFRKSSSDALEFAFTALGRLNLQDTDILGNGITFEKAVFY